LSLYNPDQLDASQAEVILKRLVYRELQSKMSPAAARSRIEELLRDLGGAANTQAVSKAAEAQLEAQAQTVLQDLEAGLKRFSLYLDWPEVGRLRSLMGVIRQDPEASTVRALMREGQEVQSQLEDKLQAALLRQTRDISELQASLERVQSVGGPKVRRLDNYIKAIQEAHTQETLAIAEVERARLLAAEMRKLVESSVVQNPTGEMAITVEDDVIQAERDPTWDDTELVVDLDFESLSVEQQTRIREIDVAEDQRRLEALLDRYAMLVSHPKVVAETSTLLTELGNNNPVGERIAALEEQFKNLYSERLSHSKTSYDLLVARLQRLELAKDKASGLAAKLRVAGETLQGGGLPTDLAELERGLEALEADERAQREAKERHVRLSSQLAAVRADAEASLSSFTDNFDVEMFLATLADLPPTEETIGRAQQGLSELLAQLTREREEESLKRVGLRAAVQAIPSLEGLESHKVALLGRLEQTPIDEIERAIASLLAQSKQIVASKLTHFETQLTALESALREPLDGLRNQLQAVRENLTHGRFVDTSSLERSLQEIIVTRRANMAEELTRYEMTARSMKGLGGEDLEQNVIAARAELQAGRFPNLEEIQGQITRLRRAQEALRAELGGRINALIEAYEAHKSVGGETVLRLKPMCDFLQSAAQRLDRLGASGLLEVRRALEDAERLEAQLEGEFKAAQSVMKQLQGADLDSLLDVFDSPAVVATVVAEEPPKPVQVVNVTLPADLTDALSSFQFRGVEAVALIEDGNLLWGNLPIQSRMAQSVFDDLIHLANEMKSGTPQLSVISLTSLVVVLLPMNNKGLVVLADKNLLSRILMQIEKQRDVLEKA
jgi:chromosome segregation protein